MRHNFSTVVAILAVAAGTSVLSRPALAGDASPSHKSTASDSQLLLAQNSNSSFALLQDIQRLREQVRNLRGQVDTLKYQLRQSEQGQRDLYENLDNRLSALENGGSAAGSSDRNTSSSSRDYSSNDYGAPASGASAGGSSAAGSPQVQSQYMDAFNKLQNGQYDAAVSGFKSFLDQHPESSYSDNAWYWLGEANYVKRNYSASLQAFQTVVNRFKDSNKTASSLYKIGLIQVEQGQTDNAMATLERVVSEYPNESAAQMARKKLRSLGG